MSSPRWRDLWERRVPHVVGIYLGASWAVLEFVGFMVSQYVLSPHLVTLCLVVLVSLFPTVVVVAYYHGKTGRQGLAAVEKIFIPGNILVLALLLAVMFSGKDLGAATTTVVVTDEQGQDIERRAPKEEFIQRVAVFAFQNKSGDPEWDWLQLGVPVLVGVDLEQAEFLRPLHCFAEQETSGEPDSPANLPLAEQWDLATKGGAGHSVTGTFSLSQEGLEAEVRIYDARRGALISDEILAGATPMRLADEVSVQIREALEVLPNADQEVVDFPVEELLSGSIPAVRSFVRADFYTSNFGDERVKGLLMDAVREDSTFARASSLLSTWFFAANRPLEAEEYRALAARHDYRLQEVRRWDLRAMEPLYEYDLEKALEIARLQSDLFPEDELASWKLGNLLRIVGDSAGALAAFQEAYEIDRARFSFVEALVNALTSLGRFQEAGEILQAFTRDYPDRPNGFRALGDLAALQGDFDTAVRSYERGLLLDPGDSESLEELGEIALWHGRFDEVMEYAERILSNSPENTLGPALLSIYHRWQGHSAPALEWVDRTLDSVDKESGRAQGLVFRAYSTGVYVRSGRPDRALAILDTLRRESQPLASFGEAAFYHAMEDPESLAGVMPQARLLVDFLPVYKQPVDFFEAEALRMQGRCEEAIPIYKALREDMSTSYSESLPGLITGYTGSFDANPFTSLGACYRATGRFEAAEDVLQTVLGLIPVHPQTQYEIALLYEEQGRMEEARAAIGIALDVWAEADEGYRPAARAREASARLGR